MMKPRDWINNHCVINGCSLIESVVAYLDEQHAAGQHPWEAWMRKLGQHCEHMIPWTEDCLRCPRKAIDLPHRYWFDRAAEHAAGQGERESAFSEAAMNRAEAKPGPEWEAFKRGDFVLFNERIFEVMFWGRSERMWFIKATDDEIGLRSAWVFTREIKLFDPPPIAPVAEPPSPADANPGNHCPMHGGHGSTEDCLTCAAIVKTAGAEPKKTDWDRKQAGEPWNNQELLGLRDKERAARSHIVGPRGCPGHDVRTPGCSWCADEAALTACEPPSAEDAWSDIPAPIQDTHDRGSFITGYNHALVAAAMAQLYAAPLAAGGPTINKCVVDEVVASYNRLVNELRSKNVGLETRCSLLAADLGELGVEEPGSLDTPEGAAAQARIKRLESELAAAKTRRQSTTLSHYTAVEAAWQRRIKAEPWRENQRDGYLVGCADGMRLRETEPSHAALEQQLATVEASNRSLDAQLTMYQDATAKLEAERDAAVNWRKVAENNAAHLAAKLGEAKSALTEANTRISALTGEKDILIAACAEANDALAEANARAAALQAAYDKHDVETTQSPTRATGIPYWVIERLDKCGPCYLDTRRAVPHWTYDRGECDRFTSEALAGEEYSRLTAENRMVSKITEHEEPLPSKVQSTKLAGEPVGARLK